MKKKVLISLFLILVIISSSFVLYGCNKSNDGIEFTDIFKSYSSNSEYTSYKLEFTLPEGWSVYTQSSTSSSNAANIYSDVGYLSDINAFIVKDGSVNSLSIVKCGDTKTYFKDGMPGMIFPSTSGISEIRIACGLIACKFKSGNVGVYNLNGKTVLSRTLTSCASSKHLDSVIKILDQGLIAVAGSNDIVNGKTDTVSIYRPKTANNPSEAGLFIGRIDNPDNDLSYFDGFDSSYVSVVGNDDGEYIYYIPTTTVGDIKCTTNGTIETIEDVDNYYSEIVYVGNGKFFIHQDYTVSKTDSYDYYDGNSYYKFSRSLYTPSDDKIVAYTENSNKVFLSLSNNYYRSGKSGISTSGYLNDGYTYASYGLYIIDKVAYYDQYILDSNMNIVMSLTGNFGVTIKDQQKSKVGYYDLVMTNVDGYYYIPLTPSAMRVYNDNGELVGSNDKEYTILTQTLSNKVMIASIQDPDDSSNALYGAFNVRGDEIINFKYLDILKFRGNYSAAKKADSNGNKKYYIIGNDGYEVTEMSDGSKPLSDIATASSSSTTYIIKNGCYMYKKTINDKTYYGIKNFNPDVNKNIVMDAFLETGSVLYSNSLSPDNVFVFECLTSGASTQYKIYRLI